MVGDRWIGERLRVERKRLHLSLAELANITGVSKTYLVRLETDPKANPSLEILFRIAEALDTTVADLLGRPSVQAAADELTISPSLRVFADNVGLPEKEVLVLASIRWRKGEEPKSPQRWQYIHDSLKVSRALDDQP
jgi:transcriptional regulator with XRE-family HTH domain